MNSTCINPQLVQELQQDLDGMDGDDGGDEDAAVDEDGDRCLGLPDLRRAKMDPLGKFPLQMPSGGEVSVISGCSVCRLSDPVARGETI